MLNQHALEAELALCMKELSWFLSSNESRSAVDIAKEIDMLKRSERKMQLEEEKIAVGLHDSQRTADFLDMCVQRMRERGIVNSDHISAFERESSYYHGQCKKLEDDKELLKSELNQVEDQLRRLKSELEVAKEGIVFGRYGPLPRDIYHALMRLSKPQLSQIYKHMKLVEAQIANAELSTAGMEINSEIFQQLKAIKGMVQNGLSNGRGINVETYAAFIHLWLIELTFHDLSDAVKQFQMDEDISNYLRKDNYITQTHLSVVMNDMKEAKMFDE